MLNTNSQTNRLYLFLVYLLTPFISLFGCTSTYHVHHNFYEATNSSFHGGYCSHHDSKQALYSFTQIFPERPTLTGCQIPKPPIDLEHFYCFTQYLLHITLQTLQCKMTIVSSSSRETQHFSKNQNSTHI